MKKTLLLCILLTGCSSLPFPKSNVTNDQILSLKIGQTSDEIIKAFGKPIHWENFEDGYFTHFYTNDWEDGAQIFCRNLAIVYDSSNKVVYHSFTKNGSDPKARCNHYTAYSAQQSASWSAFAASVSKSMETTNSNNSSSSSNGKFCHYYDSGTKGSCYSSLSSCKSAIYGDYGGFCTFEQE
jgi:outer membrane protein assembly factor BamE (lipoprotein component of BamABCDE complex)